MKRRILSLLLALSLCVGMLPAPVLAEEATTAQTAEATGTEAPPAPSEDPVPTEATEPTEAAEPVEATEPTEATVPTEASSSAEVPEATEPTELTEPTENPAPTEPTQDLAVTFVQALLDALPAPEDMTDDLLPALEEAYAAYLALTEAQQAEITGAERFMALFDWMNSQVTTLAAEETISGSVTWNNKTFTTPIKLTGDTTLTLEGANKIECDQPLDLNGNNLTIQGTGTLELVGAGGSSYLTGATLCDSTWTGSSSSSGGTLTIAGGTVQVSGSNQNAVCVYSLELNGGKLEARGSRAGIACALLKTASGSLYATGGSYGICMYSPFSYGTAVNKLEILVSKERDADPAEMESADEDAIKNAGRGEFLTVYIGEVTGPLFSVKAQKGYLYEGLAAQKATFAISAKNVYTDTLKAEWVGDHLGLSANLSADRESLWVTTSSDVKQGTYDLTITVTGTDGMTVTKTATVTVFGPPVTVTTQPQDTYAKCPEGDVDSWQGDDEVQVAGALATGVTEDISYQWKLEDGTVLDGFTQSTVTLKDLYKYLSDGGKLTQQTDKPWLSSAKVYCTLTVGTYSVNTNTVTMTVNTCKGERVNHDGSCKQCGEFHRQDPLLVDEDGYFTVVPDESAYDPAFVGPNLVKGGTFYLTKDLLHRGLDAAYTPAGSEDVTLDLQGHTLELLKMGNFPVNSITLKNGTLTQCVYSDAEGKLILDGVTITGGNLITNYNFLEITVQGESVFEEAISFNTAYYKPVHLRGGTFENGINISDGELALSLLDDGFAYQSFRGILDASIPENIAGKEIQVVAHECEYVSGKCVCGRTCDHVDTVDDDGYCTFCHALVEAYAIGQTRYKSLEDALTAAEKGDTITLRGDFYQGAITVEINKNVTLDLGGHTLTGNAETPVLRVMDTDVTIQNGSVENTNTAKSIQAVTVGKLGVSGLMLTVKNVAFTGSITAVTPRASALSVQPSNVARVESGTFTGGIYVEGDLIMTGGSTTKLEFGYAQGKAELSGGTFDSINPGNADYAALLVKGYAYQSGTSLVKLADMNSTAVEVVKCTHPDGLSADTACPYCGKTCAHTGVSDETGLCPDCGYQVYTAKIDDKLYATAAKALENAEDNQTVTLLANDTLPEGYTLSKKITLNLKGKTLRGSGLTVTGNLTVQGSGKLSVPVEIRGCLTLDGAATIPNDVQVNADGSLIMNNLSGMITTLYVNAGGSLELRDGGIGSLYVNDGGKALLSGGRIGQRVVVNSGNLQSILAEGKALVKTNGGTVVDGTLSHAIGAMRVESHTHTFLSDGKCACGVQASIQVEAGTDSFYFDDFEEAVTKAQSQSGSTLRLLKDVTYSGTSYISIASGTFTIDWNGFTLSGGNWLPLLSFDGTSNVTLKDSSGTNAGGVKNTGHEAAVRFALGTSGSATIEGGTYSPQVMVRNGYFGPVRISGGVFENPAGSDKNGALYNENGKLNGMLADGFVFAYGEDGSEILNAYKISLSDTGRDVYVVSHIHDSFDEDGVCVCGYPCPHEHFDEDGKCTLCRKTCPHPSYEDGKCTVCGRVCYHWDVSTKDGVTTCKTCGLVMTVMVQIPNEIIQYTTDLAAALNNAEDGTYITLLDDVVLEKNADIIDGKEVALDMNGHNIKQGGRTLNVNEKIDDESGANLILKGSGDLSVSVNVYGDGQLDMTDWTGTATCVNLYDVCDFVGPTGEGHIAQLITNSWRDDQKGTILLQGGTIGTLWLNSYQDFEMSLGSLLKSGYAAKNDGEYLSYDHLIKYEYSNYTSKENYLYNLTIEPCPHTGLDENGRCTYCNQTGFAAMVTTKDGVTTGYTDIRTAIIQICNHNDCTLKLLQDVTDTSLRINDFPMNGTLDLNGKKISTDLTCASRTGLRIVNTADSETVFNCLKVLTVNGGKVTIDDASGSIQFRVLEIDDGSLADLLPEGCAYRSDLGAKDWISAEDAANSKILNWVRVQEAPVKSLTLTANQTTVTYGESETVTLSTSRTLIGGVSARYAWAEVLSDGTVQTFPEEVNTSFTLPAGVSAGVHTYRVSVTAGGYTLSKTIQITVTKAAGTLENKDYPTQFTYGDTIPEPKRENFTSNNSSGTFTYEWELAREDGQPGALPAGSVPKNAGTYILRVTVESDGNYETVQNDFTVTISPLTISIENIGYVLGEDLIYNGQPQTAGFQVITANGMRLNYTLTGNTATDAGSYTMTVTGYGNNFTGSVEIPWEIKPRDLTNAVVTLGDSLTYNGQEQTQTVASVTVEGMDSPLTEGVDFQVNANTRTDAGDYSMSIAPVNNNFTGIADVSWSIAPKDISKARVVRPGSDKLTYNGKPQTPTGVYVIADGLTATVDVAASPRTNAGMYDMTVTGTGNFTGSLIANWYIGRKSIEGATVALDKILTYNGQEQTQTVVSVTVDDLDATFDVTGNTGTDAGNYTMTITGTGNFTGSKDLTWEIQPLTLSSVRVSALTKPYDGTTAAGTPTVEFFYTVGTEIAQLRGLTENEDYTLTVGSFTSPDVHQETLTVDIRLLRNYVGSDGSDRVTLNAAAAITPAEPKTPQEGSLTVTNGNVTDYTFGSLTDLLAPLDASCTYGEITFGTPTVKELAQGYAMTAELRDGALTLKVTGTGSVDGGQVAVVTVPATTQNYGDIPLTVSVRAVNKIIPKVSSIVAEDIVYGQLLQDSTITSFEAYEPVDSSTEERVPIPGTFRWETPDAKLSAGTYQMYAIFEPEDLSNYETVTCLVTITVRPRPITFSGATVEPKNYDGTAGAKVFANGFGCFSNVVSDDFATLSYTITAAFSDKNVARDTNGNVISKPVSLSVTLTGDTAKNYVLTEDSQTTASSIIYPIPVIITGGLTAIDRYYIPGDTSVEIRKGNVTFDGKLAQDDLDVQTGSGVLFSEDAGKDKSVVCIPVLSGTDKGNYYLNSFPELTVTILQAEQTLSFEDAAVTKTFGDAAFRITPDHSTGDGTLRYTSSDSSVATVDELSGTVTVVGAGTAQITAAAAETTNYLAASASYTLTVQKAAGALENRDYPTAFTYGDSIPIPSIERFRTNSTGAFHYRWEPEAPKNAGAYTLTVSVEADANHTASSLTIPVVMEKAYRSEPDIRKENETISGKQDGWVHVTNAPALEYRLQGAADWTPVAVAAASADVGPLAPGTYEFRVPEDENHTSSTAETVRILSGRKLTVTLPTDQTDFTMTANTLELDWHGTLELTLTLAPKYYRTMAFAVMAGDQRLTEENGKFTLTDVETDIVLSVTGLNLDEYAPTLRILGPDGITWDSQAGSADFDILPGSRDTFDFSAIDAGSGLSGLWYCLSSELQTDLDALPWASVELDPASGGYQKVTVPNVGTYYLYAKAEDRVGNVSYARTGKLIKDIDGNYLFVTNDPDFDGETGVTIDGKTYPIAERNGERYVHLPASGDLLTLYTYNNEGNYPQGMKVYRISRQAGGAQAAHIPELNDLLLYAGCSIRLNGTKGIRMITSVDETVKKALISSAGLAGFTLEEYGTVVMRGVGEPTLEDSKYNFAYKNGTADPIFGRSGSRILYTNVLVGFRLEDCKDDLTLRPYIILKDQAGTRYTVYGGCVVRSIGYIAKQNADTYAPGTPGYQYIHEIIDAVGQG